eukprot:RCo029864
MGGGGSPARWWKAVETSLRTPRVQCGLCPRKCLLKDGERGFCYIRQNQGGELVLTSYGRSSGFFVDPIEKKPLYHFLPGSNILSFGTAGCNLGCQFCQNWDISKAQSMDRLAYAVAPEEIAEAAVNEGCSSVAFTYNDPVIFAEYAIDTAKECRKRGVHTVAVTAGYIAEEARAEFFADIDAANVDLKGFTDSFYRRLCKATLQPVLDTLVYLRHHTSVWLEITTLLIPGENDSPQELHEMTQWIARNLGVDVPLHFSAFHPDYNLRDKPKTPLETLQRARQIALDNGLKFVYTGNVDDPSGGATRCPNCSAALIRRDWYTLRTYEVESGRCPHCQAVLPGVFSDTCSLKYGRRWRPMFRKLNALGSGH